MCVLLKDDEIKTINSREELQEYLDFRKTHDKWFISPINLMQVFTKSSSELINTFKREPGLLFPILRFRIVQRMGLICF